MATREEIIKELFKNQDKEYRDFQSGLTPNLEKEAFIGVRTPVLKKYAKEISGEENTKEFLRSLPHEYFDENQLHAFIISGIKDFHKCMEETEAFLPYVNNWATCDQMSPGVFKKNKEELLQKVWQWLDSRETYTVRFGIKMLMSFFLDEDFDIVYPERVSRLRSEEYYVNMMVAWYFATALAKQYEAILPFIEEKRLPVWTHNKTIQKAIESYRISPEQKEHLRGLKTKKAGRGRKNDKHI